jgi:hypothetical protein
MTAGLHAISRRVFLLATGALATAAAVVATPVAAAFEKRRPVVMFFDGQLWLDTSGAGAEYRAPSGVRVGPSLSDEELHRTRGHI